MTGEEYHIPEKALDSGPSQTPETDATEASSMDKAPEGTEAVSAAPEDEELELPGGTVTVVDPETGEVRYRLRNEDPGDPRTYTYEQVWQEEEGYEPEGLEQYDEQDVPPYHVDVTNTEVLREFFDDSYFTRNLRIELANYLYYFTQDGDTHYSATINEGAVHNTDAGTIAFDVTVDKFPDELVHCEYHPIHKLFGFKSGLGDMSLEIQNKISSEGKSVSRQTLMEKQSGNGTDIADGTEPKETSGTSDKE